MVNDARTAPSGRLRSAIEPIARQFDELRRLIDGEPVAMPTAYIASKVARAPALREVARLLERIGLCRVRASWVMSGEVTGPAAQRALWLTCIEEARSADLVLLMVDEGDTLKGCLIECGAALAQGKPVFQIGVCHSLRAGDGSDGSFTSHPLWFKALDVDDAIARWRAWSARAVAGATP